jgi:hypothetical protein
MRFINCLIFSLYLLPSYTQNNHVYVYEDLPCSLPDKQDITQHSSCKPVNQTFGNQATNQIDSNITKSNICLTPLVDILGSVTPGFQFKTAAGISVLGSFKKTWKVQASCLSGVSNMDSIFSPPAFFQKRGDTYTSFADLRVRGSYSPNEVFNFEAGLDHHFIGEGCRSLFLSDYGKPYPFARLQSRFWRVEYSVIYQFLREKIENNWKNKYAATHYLSLNAAKWLNIGIFETVVFLPKDTLLNRGYDVEYLNPVIFYRPQEYALGSSDNVLLGASFHAHYKKQSLYGQLILDEFFLAEIKARSGWWANKFGGQIGCKGHYSRKGWNYFYRLEYNFVRPYTYAHLNEGQNYANQGSTMAHPWGANFREILLEGKMDNQHFLLKFFLSYGVQGLDKDGYSYGANLYQPYIFRPYDYDHFIGQGKQNNTLRLIASAAYKMSKNYFMQVFIETHLRIDSGYDSIRFLPVLGVRSQLWNDYRNF